MDKFTSECTVVLGKGRVLGVKNQDRDDGNQLTSYDYRISRIPGGYSEVSEGSSDVILHNLNGTPGKGRISSDFKRGSSYSKTSDISPTGTRSFTTSRSTFQTKRESKTFSSFSNRRSSFDPKSPLSSTTSVSSSISSPRFGERSRTNRSSENLARKSSSETLANETNENAESPKTSVRRTSSKTGIPTSITSKSTSSVSKVEYSTRPGFQRQTSGSSKTTASKSETVKSDSEKSDSGTQSNQTSRSGTKSPSRLSYSERSYSPSSSKKFPPDVPPKPSTPKNKLTSEDTPDISSATTEESRDFRRGSRTLSSSILSKTSKFEKSAESAQISPREPPPKRISNLNISATVEISERKNEFENQINNVKRTTSESEDNFKNRIISQSSVSEKMAKFEKAAIDSASPDTSKPKRETLTLSLHSNLSSSPKGEGYFRNEVVEEVISPSRSPLLGNKPWKKTDSATSVLAKTAKFEKAASLKSPTEENGPSSGRPEGFARRVKRTESSTNVLAKTAKFEKVAATAGVDSSFKKRSNPNLAMSPTSPTPADEVTLSTTIISKTEDAKEPVEIADEHDLTPWRRRARESKMETLENKEAEARLERRRSRKSESSTEESPRRRRGESIEVNEEPKTDTAPWRSRRAETYAAEPKRSLSRSEAFDDGTEIKLEEDSIRSRREARGSRSYSQTEKVESSKYESRTPVEEPLRIRRHVNYGHEDDHNCLPSSHSHPSHVEASVTLEANSSVTTISNEAQSEFITEALSAHNTYRRKHRTPRLKHSEELSNLAKEWATYLVENGLSETQGLKNVGQNVFTKWSTSRTIDISGQTVADQWYSEGSSYKYDQEPAYIKGNFTQMIWFSSEEFGIAKVKSNTGRIIIVANYRPAGNIIGQYIDNVLPPK